MSTESSPVSMPEENEYVLGTHDEEIARLGLQHNVWRPRVLDAWRRAGFSAGQTILDIGCGPGYASIDLAEVVGPAGEIIAIDKSARFIAVLESTQRRLGLKNISSHHLDVDESDLPPLCVDAVWARWVFAFVRRPKELIRRAARALRPGGTFVLHEYFDYSTWQFAPGSPELEEFVRAVITSWRDEGGEPDIALDLPSWLAGEGFELRTLNPIIDVVTPSNVIWQWLEAFVDVGLKRLVSLHRMPSHRARQISAEFAARKSDPTALMITPGVLEIIAVRQ